MISESRKLAIYGVSGILAASLVIASIAQTQYSYMAQSPEKRYFTVSILFTGLSAVNLTIIEKYGGEVIDPWSLEYSAYVHAKIPRENITQLAEEDVIELIGYYGHDVLYGEEEPPWGIKVENTSEQLKLTMYLEKTMFQLGEDVKIKLILTNIGEQNVTLSKGAINFNFFVNNSTGLVYKWTFGKVWVPERDRIILKPGENISGVPYKWEQIYHVDQEIVEGKIVPKYNFLPASPGIYYIVGQELLSYTKMQTPPTEITILQP